MMGTKGWMWKPRTLCTLISICHFELENWVFSPSWFSFTTFSTVPVWGVLPGWCFAVPYSWGSQKTVSQVGNLQKEWVYGDWKVRLLDYCSVLLFYVVFRAEVLDITAKVVYIDAPMISGWLADDRTFVPHIYIQSTYQPNWQTLPFHHYLHNMYTQYKKNRMPIIV